MKSHVFLHSPLVRQPSSLMASSLSNMHSCRGAALILALLIVAAVTGLAINFAAQFQLSAARGENRWHGAQAREYLLAGEDFGIFALDEDEDKEKDSLDEPWALGLNRTAIEGGWIEGFMEDAQGRININALLGSGKKEANAQEWEKFTPAQRRFIRLLQSFEDIPVDVSQAKEITYAVIDWIDEDNNESGFGGAESNYYMDLEIPYRAANQPMKSTSELRLVKNMTPELFLAIEPFIVALPSKETAININTAPSQVLRTINRQNDLAPLTQIDGETMIEDRGESGFGDISDFMESTVPKQVSQEQNDIPKSGLSIKSEYFIAKGVVEIGRQRRSATSLIRRGQADDYPTAVIQRSDHNL